MQTVEKMEVEIKILTATLPHEAEDARKIHVQWHRKKDFLATKKVYVDKQNNTHRFQEKHAFFKIQPRFTRNGDEWVSDINQFKFFADVTEEIGVFNFDLTSFIGKPARKQKVTLVGEDAPETPNAMRGNVGAFAGACFEFSIKVTPRDQVPEKKPKPAAKAAALAQPKRPSSTTNAATAKAAEIQKRKMQMVAEANQALERQKKEAARKAQQPQDHGLDMSVVNDVGSVEEYTSELEEEINVRLQGDLSKLRAENEAEIRQQELYIAKYKKTREELEQRKAELEKLLNQPVFVAKGEEKSHITKQRCRIADLFKELEAEKRRKQQLNDKVEAFNEIMERIESGTGTREQELAKLSQELSEEQNRLQNEIDNSISVKLHQKTYEIEFDDY